MFSFIKNKINAVFRPLSSLFEKNNVDEEVIQALEKTLILADVGVATTRIIIDDLKAHIKNGAIAQGYDLKKALMHELISMLKPYQNNNPTVYLLVGINGSGKTTFAAKLGHMLKNKNHTVLYAAADTFRAAAREQLEHWAQRIGLDVISNNSTKDPGAIVFTACQALKSNTHDKLIIDTAGRLQTKQNLMAELGKLKRILQKALPEHRISTLLTIDTMLGQNSLEQARIFNEAVPVDGIVLTKMDGTAKGGIVFSLSHNLNLPIAYISTGESLNNVELFDPQKYVHALFND